jgi:hypothetical protein
MLLPWLTLNLDLPVSAFLLSSWDYKGCATMPGHFFRNFSRKSKSEPEKQNKHWIPLNLK